MNGKRIILIGPCGAGKSTVGRLLAASLGCRFVDLDSVRVDIYKATDYSEAAADDAYKNGGVIGWHEYIKPYEFYSVKSVLSDCDNAVIAFGGGQSVYDDTEYAEPFVRMMSNERNVFRLLPSENERDALRILDSRIENEDERILNRLFVRSVTNMKTGRLIITGVKGPEMVAAEIIKLLRQ